MKKILKTLLVAIPAIGSIGAATSVGVIFTKKNTELKKKYTNLNQEMEKSDSNIFVQEAVIKSLEHSKFLLENLQEQVQSRQTNATHDIEVISNQLEEIKVKVNTIQTQLQANQVELNKAREEEERLTQEIELAKINHNENDKVAQLATIRSEAHQRAWLQDSLIKQLQTQLEQLTKQKEALEEKLKTSQLELEHLLHESQNEIESYKAKVEELTQKIAELKSANPTTESQNIYIETISNIKSLNDKLSESNANQELLTFVGNPSVIKNWDNANAKKELQDFMNDLFGAKEGLSDSELSGRNQKIDNFIYFSKLIFDFLENKVSSDAGLNTFDIIQYSTGQSSQIAYENSQKTSDDLIYSYSPRVISLVINIISYMFTLPQ